MGYADKPFKAKKVLKFAELVGGHQASVDRFTHEEERHI